MPQFWTQTRGEGLSQGDYLLGCYIPIVDNTFGKDQDIPQDGQPKIVDTTIAVFDVIVITQSCDLENDKAKLVALCPVFPIAEYETINTSFKQKGKWESVRQGRFEGLHLLASPDDPENNRSALVVDFREIYSLPIDYLKNHAEEMGDRWCLRSPYLEHFSQSFARFFMRVGLPLGIPPFK